MSGFFGSDSKREADDIAAQEADQLEAEESEDWFRYHRIGAEIAATLRYRAAEELAAEFGTDVSEWLV